MNEEAEDLAGVGAMIRGGIGPDIYPLIREQLAVFLERTQEWIDADERWDEREFLEAFGGRGCAADLLVDAANRALRIWKRDR